jgi:flagellar biosynthetic protein FliS
MNYARRYHAVATETASSERLLILLMHAALSSMEQAKALFEEQGDAKRIDELLHKALNIVQELQSTLDVSRSASITGPLADVYDFVVWKLLEAKNRRRAESVSNAIRAFGPIVDAFDGAIGVARAH